MRIRPTGCELLSTAKTVLRENVLPYVPSDEQQTIQEIQRAMALAAHTLELELPVRPEDLQMLKTARAALRGKLLAQLPKERQYHVRLAAKAIAIATNELANGNDPERNELGRLTALLHEVPQPAATARDVRNQLESLYGRLSAEIRHGRSDPGSAGYAATFAHLLEITRQALRESNPAFLDSHAKLTHGG